MITSFRDHVVLLVITGALFFGALGSVRLWDFDETYYTACAAEMHARGEWAVPYYNGEVFGHKPILMYWGMRTAFLLFGVGEFAARFWSAVCGIGTTLMTYHLARRLGGREVALTAALLLCTMVLFVVASRGATPDSLLMFFQTAALLVYVTAVFEAPRPVRNADESPKLRHAGVYFPRRWSTAAAMYALMGIAVLAKGPIGVVLPTAVIGMFLLIKRLPEVDATDQNTQPWLLRTTLRLLRPFHPLHFVRTCLAMRPVTAIAMVAFVAGPWYAWVGWRTDGLWLTEFFWTHHFGRAVNSMEGHSGSLLYYPTAVLFGTFPWSVFAVPFLLDLTRRMRERRPLNDAVLLAVCWAAVYIGIFSIAGTKLPSYVTPMYPAIAFLMAAYFRNWCHGLQRHGAAWSHCALVVLGAVGVSIAIGLTVASRQLLPGAPWLGPIGAIPVVGALVAIAMVRGRTTPCCQRAFAALVVTAIVVNVAIFQFVATRVSSHRTYPALIADLRTMRTNFDLAAYGHLDPSWVYYAGQTVRFCPDRDLDQVALYLLEPGDHRLVVTTEHRYVDDIRPIFGEAVRQVHRKARFLQPSHDGIVVFEKSDVAHADAILAGAASSYAETRGRELPEKILEKSSTERVAWSDEEPRQTPRWSAPQRTAGRETRWR